MREFGTLLIIISTFCGDAVASFFDLEELESFHYSINFINDPLNEEMLGEPPSDTISLPMRNNLGQPFHCILPSPEILIADKMAKPSTPEVSPDVMKDILELLNPLQDHPCLKRSEGYWEYELCYGQYIKQYHTQDNKPVGNIIILGNYDLDYTEKEHGKNRLLRHYSQYYINGSICDELGTPRKAEVRYVCDPATPSEIITNVEEPVLCEYIITVKTSRTCSFPQMMPIPKSLEKSIDCFPLLTSSQFSDYMESKAKRIEMSKGLSGSSDSILNALTDDKMAEKLIDELVTLVQSSILDTSTPEKSKLTVINAQKYLNNIADLATEKDEASMDPSGDNSEPAQAEKDDDVEEMIKESSELMKKLYEKYSTEDLSKIMDKIENGAKSSVDEIIQEAADEFKMYLKPLKKAEAGQVLASSLDSLMTRIKSAIKDVDKGIQDIEEIIKEDKEMLEDLENSLETEQEDEASTDEDSILQPPPPSPIFTQEGKVEDDIEDSIDSGESIGKHDGKRSVKKDLSLQEEGYEGPPLDEEKTDEELKKSFDHILSSVQSKINKKLGTVQVKVVSASALDEADDLPSSNDEEDEQYYSRMVYESLVGNNKAYEDLKKYRRDRKGYLFSSHTKNTVEESEKLSSGEEDSQKPATDVPKGTLLKVPIRLPAVMRKALPSNINSHEKEKVDYGKNILRKKNNNILMKDQPKNRRPKDDL